MKPHTSIPRLATLFVAIFSILLLNIAVARPIAARLTPGRYIVSEEDTANTYVPFTGNNSLRLNNVNIKAMRDFIDRYKDVNNASWYKVDNGFVAEFKTLYAVTTVTYKKNGKWLYTITSYSEEHLQEDVRALVKSTYYDYDIVNIQEIKVPLKDSNIYLVYIQDATSIKVLRVYNGEMEVIHDYIRG